MGFYGNKYELSMNDHFNSIRFKRYKEGNETAFPEAASVLGSTGLSLTATVPVQQIDFATGNKWIEFVVANESADVNDPNDLVAFGVTLYHKKAEGIDEKGASGSLADFSTAIKKDAADNPIVDKQGNKILGYGKSFSVKQFQFDQAGHAVGTGANTSVTYALPPVISKNSDFETAQQLQMEIATAQPGSQAQVAKQNELDALVQDYPFSAKQILAPVVNNTLDLQTLNTIIGPSLGDYDVNTRLGLQTEVTNLMSDLDDLEEKFAGLSVEANQTKGTQKPGIHFLNEESQTSSYTKYVSPTSFDDNNPHYIASGLHGEVFNYYDVSNIDDNSSELNANNNLVLGDYSHAEGQATRTIGAFAHAENGGKFTINNKLYSYGTTAYGISSHAEGRSDIRIQSFKITNIVSGTEGSNNIYTLTIENDTLMDYVLIPNENEVDLQKYIASLCVGIDVYNSSTSAWQYKIYPIAAVDSVNALTKTLVIKIKTDLIDTVQQNQFLELCSGIAFGDYSHSEGNGCLAQGLASHAEGHRVLAKGSRAHAEGFRTSAFGENAHAEGSYTDARGDNSHAEGTSEIVSNNIANYLIAYGKASHAEGVSTYAGGEGSHTEGYLTKTGEFSETGTYVSQGEYAHAEGSETLAQGYAAHAEGIKTKATARGSHAEGVEVNNAKSEATAEGAHAEGGGCHAVGPYSHAEGKNTRAATEASHSSGTGTVTQYASETVVGYYNTLHEKPSDYMNTIFVIGNGTSENRSDALRVFDNGNMVVLGDIRADIGKTGSGGTLYGQVADSGGDYAEYFEWADHNPEAEDRIGLFVSLNNEGLIEKANGTIEPIGIISATASVVGDSQEFEWKNKYVRDIYGRLVFDEIVQSDGTIIKQRRLNPYYDDTLTYIPRSQRAEWSIVGLLGKIIVQDDGSAIPGGYCVPAEGGIATASTHGYRVLTRLDNSHIQVLFK